MDSLDIKDDPCLLLVMTIVLVVDNCFDSSFFETQM